MTDAEVAHLVAEVARLDATIRKMEALETPFFRQVYAEHREIQRKVEQMDIQGTHITQVRLKNIEDDLHELKEDAKAIRVTVRSALITAALSIGGQLILFAILRAGQ